MTKEQAARAKAQWLSQCLEFGWQKSDLDGLSEVWDKFKDENGNMRPPAPSVNAGSLGVGPYTLLNDRGLISGHDEKYVHAHIDDIIEVMKEYAQPSRLSLDIVDELRKACPYEGGMGWEQRYVANWNDCCDKLKELLNQWK